jgi:choline dehydrogenase-like flavoprotein
MRSGALPGAIHTAKVLMQSGAGDRTELQRTGIPVVQHLPWVGHNRQDHARFDLPGSARHIASRKAA